MADPEHRRRKYLLSILGVAGLIALFEILVGFLGADMTGLQLAALVTFGVVVLGYEAYRRIART